jgi:hypothetical protein
MLRTRDASDALQQGDIIRDVPFLLLPNVVNVAVEGVQGQQRLDSSRPESVDSLKANVGTRSLAASRVPLVLCDGVVVTQSCDIEHKGYLTLAQMFPLADRVQEAKDAIQHEEPLVLLDVVRSLTEGMQHSNLVYLGAPNGSTRIVADLLLVQSFGPAWKECFRRQRMSGLTDEGLKYLQGRLNAFTGRYATESNFWKSPHDHQIAAELMENDAAIDAAHKRLRQKIGKAPVA